LFLFKIRSSVYESYVYLTTFVYMLKDPLAKLHSFQLQLDRRQNI